MSIKPSNKQQKSSQQQLQQLTTASQSPVIQKHSLVLEPIVNEARGSILQPIANNQFGGNIIRVQDQLQDSNKQFLPENVNQQSQQPQKFLQLSPLIMSNRNNKPFKLQASVLQNSSLENLPTLKNLYQYERDSSIGQNDKGFDRVDIFSKQQFNNDTSRGVDQQGGNNNDLSQQQLERLQIIPNFKKQNAKNKKPLGKNLPPLQSHISQLVNENNSKLPDVNINQANIDTSTNFILSQQYDMNPITTKANKQQQKISSKLLSYSTIDVQNYNLQEKFPLNQEKVAKVQNQEKQQLQLFNVKSKEFEISQNPFQNKKKKTSMIELEKLTFDGLPQINLSRSPQNLQGNSMMSVTKINSHTLIEDNTKSSNQNQLESCDTQKPKRKKSKKRQQQYQIEVEQIEMFVDANIPPPQDNNQLKNQKYSNHNIGPMGNSKKKSSLDICSQLEINLPTTDLATARQQEKQNGKIQSYKQHRHNSLENNQSSLQNGSCMFPSI